VGTKGEGEIITSFSHLERKRGRFEMRFVACGCLKLGALFHGGRHLASSLVYLLRRFHYCGGSTC
jgi:hypothetical protein